MKILGSYEKAQRYIETKTGKAVEGVKYNTGPCITISRMAGAGSGLIAGEIVKYLTPVQKDPLLEWGVFDKNLIAKVLEDHNLPAQLKKFMDEGRPRLLTDMMNELFGIHPPILKLIHQTAETILELGTIGNVVIIGRGANMITRHLPNAFHVRLVAPVDFRIKNVQEFYENTRKEAEEFIKTEDVKREKYIKEHFHRDAGNPLEYHLVINTALFGIEAVGNMIGEAVLLKFPNYYTKNRS